MQSVGGWRVDELSYICTINDVKGDGEEYSKALRRSCETGCIDCIRANGEDTWGNRVPAFERGRKGSMVRAG